VLCAGGPDVEPVLDAMATDPWLSAVAATVRSKLELGPEPTLSEQLWLAVDDLSLALDAELDPELREAIVDESDLHELLPQRGAIKAAVALSHPQARETLHLLIDLSGDPTVTAPLRRALAAAPPS
jgi:hypothetical protein